MYELWNDRPIDSSVAGAASAWDKRDVMLPSHDPCIIASPPCVGRSPPPSPFRMALIPSQMDTGTGRRCSPASLHSEHSGGKYCAPSLWEVWQTRREPWGNLPFPHIRLAKVLQINYRDKTYVSETEKNYTVSKSTMKTELPFQCTAV